MLFIDVLVSVICFYRKLDLDDSYVVSVYAVRRIKKLRHNLKIRTAEQCAMCIHVCSMHDVQTKKHIELKKKCFSQLHKFHKDIPF